MWRVYLSLTVLLGMAPALAQVTEEMVPPGPHGAAPEETPTVTVTAPEPRYVAPTLRDRIGRIWAPVMINGKGPFRLVLNTGANSSAVVPTVAEKLGISLADATKVRINGATGTSTVPIIAAEQLEVGELLIQNVRLPIVPDVFGGAEGVLGPTNFTDKRILIDFGKDLIRIARSNRERAPIGFTRVPLTPNRRQLLMFELEIGTVRTMAILDTGAQQSMGNARLRAALLRNAQKTREQDIVGVTLDVAQGQSIQIPPIALGDIMVRNVYVNFGNAHIFEYWQLTRQPAMVIGMDVIGTLETVVIDYKLRELQLRARRS